MSGSRGRLWFSKLQESDDKAEQTKRSLGKKTRKPEDKDLDSQAAKTERMDQGEETS